MRAAKWLKLVDLTLCYLDQMQPVNPGDLAEGAWSVEDHRKAHRTARPMRKHPRDSETEVQSSNQPWLS